MARVWFDRPLHLPALSGHFVSSPVLHTLFHVGAFQPHLARGGDVIELQMGPVQEYIHLPAASLKQLVVSELRRFLPATEQAGLRKVVVLDHEHGFADYRVGHERDSVVITGAGLAGLVARALAAPCAICWSVPGPTTRTGGARTA